MERKRVERGGHEWMEGWREGGDWREWITDPELSVE